MKKLNLGERVVVSHGESYPYEKLPEGAHFEWASNIGNPYDGLSSVLYVVEDE